MITQASMVRYSNGIEMNGHGRKSKSPDIAMAPIRNGNGVHQQVEIPPRSKLNF